MLRKEYFVSAVFKNNKAVRLHFHAIAIYWFWQTPSLEKLCNAINASEKRMYGDTVLITSLSRI